MKNKSSRKNRDTENTNDTRIAPGLSNTKSVENIVDATASDAQSIDSVADTETPTPESIGLVCMSNVEPKEVRWLWPGLLAFGKISLMRGQGGSGKTHLCLALAAAVSTGSSLPLLSKGNEGTSAFHKVEAGNVLFISAEDDLADTIAPRLIAAGANMSRVFSYTESTERKLHYTSPMFEQLIAQSKPSIVVVDPIQGYFGNSDMNRANSVRPIMTHLRVLAEKYDCSILLVEHLTKSGQGGGFHRGLGSIDITSAARSVLMVGNDHSNPKERGITQIKSNIGNMDGVIGFTINDSGLVWNPDTYLTSSIIEGRNKKNRRYQGDDNEKEISALEEAKEFLRDNLANGEYLCKDVELEAEQSGISKQTLRRAREELKVVTVREGFGKPGYWKLPDE
ncbi:MAG: AAA family ATPase [Defluviitaleaceae bacterium]|nr:AAA family ATPase [Defluviitaleaceae bacterium]